MSAADVHSILYRGEDPLKKKFVPKNEQKTHVPRHWPGKAPEGVALHSDSEGEGSEAEKVEVKQLRMTQVLAADRRLHRLAAAATAAAAAANSQTQGERRRREAFVIQSEKERQRLEKGLEDAAELQEEEEDEWGEAAAAAAAAAAAETITDRDKLRAAVLERRRREERLLQQQQQQQQEESEESEESEFSDVSEDQPEETNVVLHKPAFVPKASRLTVMEREEQQRRVREEQQQQQQQVEQRKLETKQMVYAVLAREDEEAADAPVIPVEAQQQQQQQQQQQKNLMGSEEMPDDTDGLDAAQEYEDWKLRELERIRRDKEEQLEREKFLEAVERRRQMTAEERREDDKELDKMQPKREIRHKYNFMQKYYHRGAFFQDLARSGEEPLYLRDFNAPVGEDKVDKKTLPKILQLRRGELARGGRSKHTHLVDVDTSDLSHPWAQATRDLQGQKLLKKAAGIKGANDFERPSLRKPKQDS